MNLVPRPEVWGGRYCKKNVSGKIAKMFESLGKSAKKFERSGGKKI